ncbi:YciI family protein [Umezawaea sp. Da 62-37]|uniref:YciI family protein n=1 Tax=Umezawaea sp. Da 62-37 TaxID=3075927 RepID=UPI0028F73380|nr:YciI family protein [Umezawaea sp. Da 62-37]WNV86540.1 YciI family protein [Umezawaea sp. Da 62-37]
MKQYLLSIYQPDGPAPEPEVLGPIMADLAGWNDELRAADAWVFGAGLFPPSTATVVRAGSDGVLTTDGPFVEAKEHIGGFTVVRAPDLDAALEWGRRLSLATTLPVEVRPVQDNG